MGAAAAFIFPTTLSIISQTFPDRAQRAKAIGAWGATTGAAVALGPIAGGALLARFWWGSIFVAMVPVAAAGFIGAVVVIRPGGMAAPHALDIRGLVLGAVGLGALVYTVIQAPDAGWEVPAPSVGFVFSALGFAVLIRAERTHPNPMIDVRLFTNLRFTAASGAVTIAFFALFGFTFLIVQYFQLMRGYSALGTGVRILPVAVTLAATSGLGPVLAVRIGNKIVVAAGLAILGAGFAWVGLQTATTPYWVIVLQMILLGSGLGLSTAPATESIMGVVRPEQAGAGSAVNDATRLVGGTLGVAIIGSVYASLYRSKLDTGGRPTGSHRHRQRELRRQQRSRRPPATSQRAPTDRTCQQRLPGRPARQLRRRMRGLRPRRHHRARVPARVPRREHRARRAPPQWRGLTGAPSLRMYRRRVCLTD